MPPHMSCSATKEAIRRREKTVTRRLGWGWLAPGRLFIPVEQAMGLRKGEHHVELATCRCISNMPELLDRVVREPMYGLREMELEGFPGMDPTEFVSMFIRMNRLDRKTYRPVTQVVNRIEFEYVDDER